MGFPGRGSFGQIQAGLVILDWIGLGREVGMGGWVDGWIGNEKIRVRYGVYINSLDGSCLSGIMNILPITMALLRCTYV